MSQRLKWLWVCSALFALGCTDSSSGTKTSGVDGDGPLGSLRFALDLADGVSIDRVDYEISADDIETITGSLNVGEISGDSFTAVIGGVPAGEDRRIVLTATASDDSSCEGEATFSVEPDSLTAVQVSMRCGNGPRGSVGLDVDIGRCPTIAAASAVPATAEVGHLIFVSVATAEGDIEVAELEWLASAGSYDDPFAASTTYTCGVAGVQTLTATATDADGCMDAISLKVRCIAPGTECGNGEIEEGEECDDGNDEDGDGCSSFCEDETATDECGNGELDAGEQCDDGNTESGDGCSSQCKLEGAAPTCGNGVVEQGEECDDGNTEDDDGCSAECEDEPMMSGCGNGELEEGEECDDGNTEDGDGCSAECETEAEEPECGNGEVEEGEECDDGNAEDGDGCSAECETEDPDAVCGNGEVEGSEDCDDGNTEDGDGCSAECEDEDGGGTAECEECTEASCRSFGDMGLDVIAACLEDADAPESVELCTAVIECAVAEGCAETGVAACYCGTASDEECLAGNGDGPCRAEIEAAADSDVPATIGARLADTSYALGDAANLLTCYASFCAAQCF